MSETYIKVRLKKDSKIKDCIELLDTLKRNDLILSANINLDLLSTRQEKVSEVFKESSIHTEKYHA